jgi:uncharacterized membrane protein
MWAVGAAVALYLIRSQVRAIRATWLRRGWIGFLAFLLLAVSVYPVVATKARVHDRFNTSIGPTLDGAAYASKAEYHDQNQRIDLAADMAAIRWLQDKVDG